MLKTRQPNTLFLYESIPKTIITPSSTDPYWFPLSTVHSHFDSSNFDSLVCLMNVYMKKWKVNCMSYPSVTTPNLYFVPSSWSPSHCSNSERTTGKGSALSTISSWKRNRHTSNITLKCYSGRRGLLLDMSSLQLEVWRLWTTSGRFSLDLQWHGNRKRF